MTNPYQLRGLNKARTRVVVVIGKHQASGCRIKESNEEKALGKGSKSRKGRLFLLAAHAMRMDPFSVFILWPYYLEGFFQTFLCF